LMFPMANTIQASTNIPSPGTAQECHHLGSKLNGGAVGLKQALSPSKGAAKTQCRCCRDTSQPQMPTSCACLGHVQAQAPCACLSACTSGEGWAGGASIRSRLVRRRRDSCLTSCGSRSLKCTLCTLPAGLGRAGRLRGAGCACGARERLSGGRGMSCVAREELNATNHLERTLVAPWYRQLRSRPLDGSLRHRCAALALLQRHRLCCRHPPRAPPALPGAARPRCCLNRHQQGMQQPMATPSTSWPAPAPAAASTHWFGCGGQPQPRRGGWRRQRQRRALLRAAGVPPVLICVRDVKKRLTWIAPPGRAGMGRMPNGSAKHGPGSVRGGLQGT
jgi:hypothetical protein